VLLDDRAKRVEFGLQYARAALPTIRTTAAFLRATIDRSTGFHLPPVFLSATIAPSRVRQDGTSETAPLRPHL